MRRFLSGLGLLLLLVSALQGQTAEWKSYRNSNGNFAVLFPGEPKDSVNQSESGVQSHTLLAQENAVVYTVIYTTMASEQVVDEATFEVFKNAVFKELSKCEAGAAKPAAPGIGGYIGHWYRLSCDMPNTKVTVVGNLYWGRHYAYAVMVMFAAGVAEPEAAEKRFVESFAVIDTAK
ncbi:MAG: hypothetical protein ACXV5R_14200 [Candidatus Angelobacter sp.]